MHPSILAQRKAKAMDRILRFAERLDPEHAEALQPKGVKDPQAVEMMRLEAIADLLERLPVTAVTAPDHPGLETDESLPAPVFDDLPAPVLDASPKKSAGRKTKK